MLKIVADDKIPFLRGVLEPYADVVYLPGGAISASDVRDADALLTRTRTKCNAKLLDGSSVRFIATATIGYDHIDTDYCAMHGIRWANAPGCNSSSVAQYVASLFLRDAMKNGFSLKGKVLGVIGVGNVGGKVARVAELFGMRVLLNDPPRARKEPGKIFVPLETVLKEADYISFHTPLILNGTDRTYHMADEDFFRRLVKRPFLINSSRGEVVDSNALKSALIMKRLRGAALDVWEDEPDVDTELMGLLSYATPHIAGYSADGKANGTAMSVRSLASFFELPLTDYRPDLPAPGNSPLFLKNSISVIPDAVCASYDILRDDAMLRNSPDSFEDLRGNYPFRREFPAYAIVRKSQMNLEQTKLLSALGFTFSD